MPKLRSQTIPPAMIDAYRKALVEAAPLPYPGAQGATYPDGMKKLPRPRTEPPFTPTPSQLEQRGFFRDSVTCFNGAPANERQAYYHLATGTGLWYVDQFHARNVPLIAAGATIEEVARREAGSYDLEGLYPFGYLLKEYLSNSVEPWEIELESAPTGYQERYFSGHGAFTIVHWAAVDFWFPPMFMAVEFWDVTPTGVGTRNVFEGSAIGDPWPRHRIGLHRQGDTNAPTVVWRIDIAPPTDAWAVENWGHAAEE
jgi:hypothetical protein